MECCQVWISGASQTSPIPQCGKQESPDPTKPGFIHPPKQHHTAHGPRLREMELRSWRSVPGMGWDGWDWESCAGAAGIAEGEQMSADVRSGRSWILRKTPGKVRKGTWRRDLMDATGAFHVFLTVPGMGTSEPIGAGQTSEKFKFVPQLGIQKFILFPNCLLPASYNVFVIL